MSEKLKSNDKSLWCENCKREGIYCNQYYFYYGEAFQRQVGTATLTVVNTKKICVECGDATEILPDELKEKLKKEYKDPREEWENCPDDCRGDYMGNPDCFSCPVYVREQK